MGLERLTKTDPLQLGRFRILARLGAGGMGIVYLAEDPEGRPAAVKVVKAELAADPTFRSRFRREVEAGRRVSGICAARYLDADPRAREPWLATEYVPGPTLHAEIHRHGPVSGPRLAALAAGLTDALVSIHGAGLVHRDFKPANVILAPDAPKVIDFGVALPSNATALTSTGALVGSPAYMSPEQAQGLTDVTPAADVFSWASTLTFAARGVPPFGEGDAAGVLYRVVHDTADLTNVDPMMVPYLSAALEKDPENRPTSLELAGGLSSLLNGSAGGAPSASAVMAAWQPAWSDDIPDAAMTLAVGREMREELPPRDAIVRHQERRRANRWIVAIAVAAAVGLVAIGYFALKPDEKDVALTQQDNQTTVSNGSSLPGGSSSMPPDGGTTVVSAAGGGQTTVTAAAPAPGGAPAPSVANDATTTAFVPPPPPAVVGTGTWACGLQVQGSFTHQSTYTVSIAQPPYPVRIAATRAGSPIWKIEVPKSAPTEDRSRTITLLVTPRSATSNADFTGNPNPDHREEPETTVQIAVVRPSDGQPIQECTPASFRTGPAPPPGPP